MIIIMFVVFIDCCLFVISRVSTTGDVPGAGISDPQIQLPT